MLSFLGGCWVLSLRDVVAKFPRGVLRAFGFGDPWLVVCFFLVLWFVPVCFFLFLRFWGFCSSCLFAPALACRLCRLDALFRFFFLCFRPVIDVFLREIFASGLFGGFRTFFLFVYISGLRVSGYVPLLFFFCFCPCLSVVFRSSATIRPSQTFVPPRVMWCVRLFDLTVFFLPFFFF